jgi:sortase (surface protein transpeptidase)
MAKVEIDENTLVAQTAMVKIFNDLQNNPKTRETFFRAVKTVRPDLSIPEIDTSDPINAKIAELDERYAKFERAQEEQAALAAQRSQENEFITNWNKQKQALLAQGYYPEGVTEIEAFAQKHQIPNLEAAAALYEKQNPPTLSAPRGGLSTFSDKTDSGDYVKKLMEAAGNNGGRIHDNIVYTEAQRVMAENRNNVSRF